MNKKNGFTLIELLAVIVITSVLLILAIPKIINQVKVNKANALEANKEIIVSAARNYMLDKNISLPVSISITQLCDEDYLSCPIINPVDDTTMSGYVNVDADKNYAYADTASNDSTNTKLNNVRYIKNCINGSTANSNNHWLEIKAMSHGENVSIGKTVTTTGTPQTGKSLSLVTNNVYTYDEAQIFRINENSGLQCVIVDLAKTYDLDSITIWHYYGDTRSYYSNTTYVSSDNTTWVPVAANFYVETGQGKTVTAYDSNTTVTPIFKVSNLITNGSFEDGSVGWLLNSGSSISSGILSYVSGGSWGDATGRSDSITVGTSDSLYIKATVKTPSSSIRFGFGIISGGYNVFQTKTLPYSPSSYVDGSGILIPGGTSTTPYFGFYDTDTAGTTYVDKVLMVNLTTTFGAGNEPTQAWCDTNLNYFDGTQNMNLSL